MLLDVTNIGPVPLLLTSFDILVPAVFTTGSSFTMSMIYRRRNAAICNAGLVCTGSVRDNQFKLDGTFASLGSSNVIAPGAPAGNRGDLSWVPGFTGVTLTSLGLMNSVTAQSPITVQPGEVVGMWFFFTDGTKFARSTDSKLPALGTTATNNSVGDPSFAYVESGSLRISAAMQATAPTTPNWGNIRPFSAFFNYITVGSCSPPPVPSIPPSPPPVAAWANSQGTASGDKTVTLGMPYAAFSASPSTSAVAFAAALGPLVGVLPADVVVTKAEPFQNTTVVHFTLLTPLGGASGLLAAVTNAQLLAALRVQWPTLASAAVGDVLPAPPPPVGTFTVNFQGAHIALDISFATYQTFAFSYNGAVAMAVSKLLNVIVDDVWVYENVPGIRGGTVVGFDVTSAEQVSDVFDTSYGGQQIVPHFVLAFSKLFGLGDGSANVGDAATTPLVNALIEQGLPVTTAYYSEQPL